MIRLSPTTADNQLEIVVRRYEKGPIIMTTSRTLEDSAKLLGDRAVARGILDRFLKHTGIIELEGRGYRMHGMR